MDPSRLPTPPRARGSVLYYSILLLHPPRSPVQASTSNQRLAGTHHGVKSILMITYYVLPPCGYPTAFVFSPVLIPRDSAPIRPWAVGPWRASSRFPWPQRKRRRRALHSPRHDGSRSGAAPGQPSIKPVAWPLPLPSTICPSPVATESIARAQRERQSTALHKPAVPIRSALPPCPVAGFTSARREEQLAVVEGSSPLARRHEEGCAQAGRARRQAQGQGAQGRLRPPRHRPAGRGHEGPEDDHRGHRRPRRRRRQAAQALPRRADRLRRPGQGGEEGRKEGRQEARRRQERGRQEGRRRRQERRGEEGRRRQEAAGGEAAHVGVPALRLRALRVPAAAALLRPQRRGGPQFVRHLLIGVGAHPCPLYISSLSPLLPPPLPVDSGS